MNGFNNIFLKQKQIADKSLQGYRIYMNKDQFTIVEAQTIAEALEKSGIKNPHKIEVLKIVKKSIFTKEELSENNPIPASAAIAPQENTENA